MNEIQSGFYECRARSLAKVILENSDISEEKAIDIATRYYKSLMLDMKPDTEEILELTEKDSIEELYGN